MRWVLAAVVILAAAAATVAIVRHSTKGGDSVEHVAVPRQATPRPSPAGGGPNLPRSLVHQLGQGLMIRFNGTVTPRLLSWARQGIIGGVIVFPPLDATPETLAAAIARLDAAARAGHEPPLLVATDQEGGLVKRLPQGPPFLSPPELGARDSATLSRATGRDTGLFLRSAGIDVDLAPVLDTPGIPGAFIASRAFGSTPDTVDRNGLAFADGLSAGGVAPTVKHFPGLGLAETTTDKATIVIDASAQQLSPGLIPFRHGVQEGIPLVMVSTALYPALDPKREAAFSPTIINGLLRAQLGFQGVVITDDIASRALRLQTTPGKAAYASLLAGADIALFAHRPSDAADAYRRLKHGLATGQMNQAPLQASLARIAALKGRL